MAGPFTVTSLILPGGYIEMLALGSHLEHNYGPLTVTSPISALWVYETIGIWLTVMAFITFWYDPGVGWIFPSEGVFELRVPGPF